MTVSKLNKNIKNEGEAGYEQTPVNKKLLQDMCNKIDELVDIENTRAEAWKNLPLFDGIAVGSIVKKAQYRKIGKIVEIRGDVSELSANLSFAQLPVGYRPSAQIYAIGSCAGQRYCRYFVATDGRVGIDWTSDNNYDLAWYAINITFTVD